VTINTSMTAFDLFGPKEIEAINSTIAAELSAFERELRKQVTEEQGCLITCWTIQLTFRLHCRLQEENRKGMFEAELFTRETLHREATRRGEACRHRRTDIPGCLLPQQITTVNGMPCDRAGSQEPSAAVQEDI